MSKIKLLIALLVASFALSGCAGMNSKLNKELIDCYYDFKQEQGYSQYEIAQKREALENVLIPYTELENIEMAERCGFSHCECIFRWANFATFIAIK